MQGWSILSRTAGLGLDPATVAEIVGHDDSGDYLIATVYTKLGRRRAL